MPKLWICTLTIVIIGVGAALGDVPLPDNIKYVDPQVRFDGIEQYPGYVFYLRLKSGKGNPNIAPYTMFEVKDSKVFELKIERRVADEHLLAMDRKEFDKRKKDDATLDWLTDKAEGVLRANVTHAPNTAPINIKEVPVTVYRVTLKNGTLSVERAADKKSSSVAPVGSEPFWAYGFAGFLSISSCGVWYARRKRSGTSPIARGQ